ncbi:MAG: RbsD/FucU domain-containing protein [Verrucomicrobiota bacterium]
MLRGIPDCLSPDLVHALMSMGHGDEIVLADADFPAVTCSKRLIRADGVPLTSLLKAILPFFPLDSFVDKPVLTMDPASWGGREPESYHRFRETIKQHDAKFQDFEFIDRQDFYDRAHQAYAVVITGEADGNLILKKGPVMM